MVDPAGGALGDYGGHAGHRVTCFFWESYGVFRGLCRVHDRAIWALKVRPLVPARSSKHLHVRDGVACLASWWASVCSRRLCIGTLGALGPKSPAIAAQVEGSLGLHGHSWHLGGVAAAGLAVDGRHSRV